MELLISSPHKVGEPDSRRWQALIPGGRTVGRLARALELWLQKGTVYMGYHMVSPSAMEVFDTTQTSKILQAVLAGNILQDVACAFGWVVFFAMPTSLCAAVSG